MITKEITLEDIKTYPDVVSYIRLADRNMAVIGYTEHGFRHAELVASRARQVLQQLGYDERHQELAAIAGYLHDIGNVAERKAHPEIGVTIAFKILSDLQMPAEELGEIMAAIANHDENRGDPFGPVAAAVILADKSDVDRSRVRNIQPATFDEHDRINFAARGSTLEADAETESVSLKLDIDPSLGSIMEYFELFLTRMVVSRRAAEALGCHFSLSINGTRLL